MRLRNAMVTKYQNQEPPGEDDTLYITVPARRQSSGQRSKNGSPQRSATDIPSPRSSSRSSPTNRSASRITSNITSPTGQSFTSTSCLLLSNALGLADLTTLEKQRIETTSHLRLRSVTTLIQALCIARVQAAATSLLTLTKSPNI